MRGRALAEFHSGVRLHTAIEWKPGFLKGVRRIVCGLAVGAWLRRLEGKSQLQDEERKFSVVCEDPIVGFSFSDFSPVVFEQLSTWQSGDREFVMAMS